MRIKTPKTQKHFERETCGVLHGLECLGKAKKAERRGESGVVRGREAVGEERPREVHGGGGEGFTANAEEESDDDTQDVLGVVMNRAEVVGSKGLLGFPVPQRHVIVVDRVTEEEDLSGTGHDIS
nr:hypothetical protein CFP56_45569 [Quercus suber]